MKPAIVLCLVVGFFAGACKAQERPYFVTYSHEMEEPGNLDIEFFNAVGNRREETGSSAAILSRIWRHRLVDHGILS
jgi:hypothetical protein